MTYIRGLNWLTVVGGAMLLVIGAGAVPGAADATLVLGGTAGVIRRLSGLNIGPRGNLQNPDLTTPYQQLGTTLIRTHDYYGPLDMSTLYPDRTKDPGLQTSYNFTGLVGNELRSSDDTFHAIVTGGFEPYLRLGDSYNDVKVPTAGERANWIQAAVQVVRHYRDGQWNGFTSNLRYVEVWNEPDNSRFWPAPNTNADYYTLYSETAAALKAAFPDLKVGGPAVTPAGCLSERGRAFTRGFLDKVRSTRAPLDFFSWHMYSNNPDDYTNCAAYFRKELDARGFQDTPQHVSEWNTETEDESVADAVALRSNARGAAINTAAWINMQLASIDQEMFYRGPEPGGDGVFYGMFWTTAAPKKVGLAAELWYNITGYGNRLSVSGAASDLYALAGMNSAGDTAVLVANTSSTSRTWSYAFADGRAATTSFIVKTVSDDASEIVTTSGRTATFTIPAYGVQLVTTGTSGSTAPFTATARASAENGVVTVDVTPASADAGRAGRLFVGANVGGRWSFYTPQGWMPWIDGDYTAYFAGQLPASSTVRVILPEGFDRYRGSALYAGYGQDTAEMLAAGRYRTVLVSPVFTRMFAGSDNRPAVNWEAANTAYRPLGAAAGASPVVASQLTANQQTIDTATLDATVPPALGAPRGVSPEVFFDKASSTYYLLTTSQPSTQYSSRDGVNWSPTLTRLPAGVDWSIVEEGPSSYRLYYAEMKPGPIGAPSEPCTPKSKVLKYATSPDLLTWTVQEAVLLDDLGCGVPHVMKTSAGKYFLYFNKVEGKHGVFIASSADGLTWSTPVGPLNGNQDLVDPAPLELPDGTFVMVASTTGHEGGYQQLKLLASDNAVTWVQRKTTLLADDGGGVFDPSIELVDGKLHVWFGYSPAGSHDAATITHGLLTLGNASAPPHSGFTVSPPTKPYLMVFHTCSTTSNCEDPTNHTIRIAESSDGANWTDVSGWQGYRGSVPDVIRRENTIYVVGAGLSRIDVTTGQVTATSFYVRKTDGSDSMPRDTAFAGQVADGRLVIVYVPPMQEVEGKTSVPVKLGTEVVDSNGSSFVEYGTAVDVPLDIAGVHGWATDPDIFFNGTEWVLYVSMGSNVVSFTAPAVTGPYSLASATVVSRGAGGVPSAMVGTDRVWVYVNDGPSRDSIYIRRAVTTKGTSTIPASSFQTVLTGTPYGATTAESPGVAPNTEGIPCSDGCETIATVVAAPGQVNSAKVGRPTSSTATLTWRAPTSDGGGAMFAGSDNRPAVNWEAANTAYRPGDELNTIDLFGAMLSFNPNTGLAGPESLSVLQTKGWLAFRSDESRFKEYLRKMEERFETFIAWAKKTGFSIDREIPGAFTWNVIEPEKGAEYKWEISDLVVLSANAAGMSVSALIQPFAAWDQDSAPEDCTGLDFAYYDYKADKPTDWEAYKAFLTALVERYDGDGEEDMEGLLFPVKHWEIGNEYDGTCGGDLNEAENYFELIKISSEAIRSADSEAKVLTMGALELSSNVRDIRGFWEDFFTLGGGEYIDIFNFHYNKEKLGIAPTMDDFEEHLDFFNETMDANDAQKPMWITEFGTYSGTPEAPMPKEGQSVVTKASPTQTEEEQASWYFRYSIMAFANGVEKIFVDLYGTSNSTIGGSALHSDKGEERFFLKTLQTIAKYLENFSSSQEINEGQYVFEAGDKTVYALWNGKLPSEIKGSVTVIGLDGSVAVMEASKVNFSEESPVLLLTKD